MRHLIILLIASGVLVCRADDNATGAQTPPGPGAQTPPGPVTATAAASAPAQTATADLPLEPAWQPRPPRPPAVAPVLAAASPAPATGPPVQIASEAKWQLAGYNNDEIVYTIIITSHDSRIIHCNIQLSGFYYEKGEKLPISDRQSLTIFPDQRVPVGNWQGLDEKSGASYEVKCHPL